MSGLNISLKIIKPVFQVKCFIMNAFGLQEIFPGKTY